MQVYDAQRYVTKQRFWDAVHTMEYKLILIPLAFLLLRIWSCIINIVYVYVGLKVHAVPHQLTLALIYLSVSQTTYPHNSVSPCSPLNYHITRFYIVTLS